MLKRKASFWMLICIISVVFGCSVGFAEDGKDITISGVGTVSIPVSIAVSEFDMNGLKATCLVAKENNVFRSTMVFSVVSPKNRDLDIAELTTMLESFMKSFITSSQATILRSGSTRNVNLGTVTTDRTFLNHGVAYCVNAYTINTATTYGALVFVSPDGDSSFWESLRSKIITTAK